jgi:hypothetical protein
LKHKTLLEKIAKILIEREYISGDEFTEMIDNPEKIPLEEEGLSKKASKKRK